MMTRPPALLQRATPGVPSAPTLALTLSLATSLWAGPVAAQSTAAVAVAPAPRAADSGERAPRGVVRSVHEATLSSRVGARIVQMPVTEGSAFKRGDLLVAFDCDRTLAEIRAAEAAVEVQRKTVETNEELHQFNALGKYDLLSSKSQLNKVLAEADALRSQSRECTLLAPFSGRVVERLAREHETVAGNQPLLRIVDTEALMLDIIVPSSWLQWLAPGARFDFVIDETGRTLPGVVDRLTPTVDPVSKTTRIIGRFAGRPAGAKGASGKPVLPGMSGSAQFAVVGTATTSAAGLPALATPAAASTPRTYPAGAPGQPAARVGAVSEPAPAPATVTAFARR